MYVVSVFCVKICLSFAESLELRHDVHLLHIGRFFCIGTVLEDLYVEWTEGEKVLFV